MSEFNTLHFYDSVNYNIKEHADKFDVDSLNFCPGGVLPRTFHLKYGFFLKLVCSACLEAGYQD